MSALTMQSIEQNLYSSCTKAIVDSFDELVRGVEKHSELLKDIEIKTKLKRISKTLQTLFNKWENVPERKLFTTSPEKMNDSSLLVSELSASDTISTPAIKSESTLLSDTEDDFGRMIAISVGDTDTTTKMVLDEVTSSSSKFETSSNNTAEVLSRKDDEIVKKFRLENTEEHLIKNSCGFFVEQNSDGTWKCNPCKLEGLSEANIFTHVTGTKHRKKISENYKRETSESRLKAENNSGVNLASMRMDAIQAKKENGTIFSFQGFYCNVCQSMLNSEDSVKLHVKGAKHRKNCEDL